MKSFISKELNMIKRSYFISVEICKDGVSVKWTYQHFNFSSLLEDSIGAFNWVVNEIKSENKGLDVRVLSFNRC